MSFKTLALLIVAVEQLFADEPELQRQLQISLIASASRLLPAYGNRGPRLPRPTDPWRGWFEYLRDPVQHEGNNFARFRKEYRITPSLFQELVAPLISSWNGRGYHPEQRMAAVLHVLAHPTNYHEAGLKFGVGQSTIAHWLPMMCEFITSHFAGMINFPLPNTADEEAIFDQFRNVVVFPFVKGAIDSSLIPLATRPAAVFRQDDFWCRKGYAAIHLQAVVDYRGQFLDIFVGTPGRTHDAMVLRLSPIFESAAHLFRGSYLLGDKGYPLLPWLIVPFKGQGPEHEVIFNEEQAKARVVVEQAFGRLKGRWRMLQCLDVDMANAAMVVHACCILHNFCEGNNLPFERDVDDHYEPDENDLPENPNVVDEVEGFHVRNLLVQLMRGGALADPNIDPYNIQMEGDEEDAVHQNQMEVDDHLNQIPADPVQVAQPAPDIAQPADQQPERRQRNPLIDYAQLNIGGRGRRRRRS